jgi:hypothetical protein
MTVGRRDLLKLLVLAPVLVPGTASAQDGRTFYVSPSGDDNATGQGQGTPWRTITHVNERMANGAVGPGDTVLFQRGQTFYGKLRPPSGTSPDAAVLTIGAYGTGTRPKISSYKLLTAAGGWRQAGAGTWSVDLSTANAGVTHYGYDGGQGGGGNIGFLNVDGTVHGRRRFQLADLVGQWDFYCSGTVLYVRSTANPATLAGDLRAACDGSCVQLRNALRITGLRFVGGGGHGAQGTAANVRVDDNEFDELGGALLTGTTRYGNGVEAWIGSADVTVERNIFANIYDVALTAQGGPDSGTGAWRNLVYRNNLIYLCNQSVEFWSAGNPGSDPGFVNCVVECNICLYAGYGWSAAVRPDQHTRVHLLSYGWELPADITVRRNTFYDAPVGYRYSATSPAGLRCSDNLICLRAGTLLSNGAPQTIEQWQAWTSLKQNDLDSAFRILPSDAPIDVAAAYREVAGDHPGCTTPAPV